MRKIDPLLYGIKPGSQIGQDLKKDAVDNRDHLLKNLSIFKVGESLPSVIDHTSGMSPVKDQGNLGSCVSFSIAAMKEWQERKEHEKEVELGKPDHRKGKIYDYSEAWIYRMCKKIDDWPGEEGTSIKCGMKVLNKIGVPAENAWPYKKIYSEEPKKWAHLVARWAIGGEYYRIESIQQLKTSLMNGPVVMGIPCFVEIFYVGSDGIVLYPANINECYGGHAIAAVGMDDSSQLIKFKNSWSSEWGDKGYGYISYKYFNDLAWDTWGSKDITVTKEMLKGASAVLER